MHSVTLRPTYQNRLSIGELGSVSLALPLLEEIEISKSRMADAASDTITSKL